MCAGCWAPGGSPTSTIVTLVFEPSGVNVAVPWMPALDCECRTMTCGAGVRGDDTAHSSTATATSAGIMVAGRQPMGRSPKLRVRYDCMSRSLALGSAIAFTILLAGCTNSSSTTIVGSGPGITQIVVTDANNTRIVGFTDMTGSNWTTFGTKGTGANQFEEPIGIAFDSTHRIYITDFIGGAQRIDRVNDITGAGWTTFGSGGNGVDQFGNPLGIALDATNRIYVADADGTDRIARFDDMTGTNWVTFGAMGSGVNQFKNPFAPAIDVGGRIYVTDFFNNRIARFDDMTGTNWTTYGTTGSGVGNFAGPTGMTMDSVGRIYIVDGMNNRIVRIDDMAGTNWVSFGTAGSGVNQFQFSFACGIGSIAIGPDKRIYIADAGNNRIVRIDDMTGANWTTFGTLGAGVGNFNVPAGIAVR